MKKFYAILLVALLCAFAVLCFASCGEEEEPEVQVCLDGQHEYLAWEIETEAVCNTLGVRTRTCVICKQYTQKQQYKDTTNHKYENYVCVYCGDQTSPKAVGFTLSDDGKYYILSSIDDNNATEYAIPAKYEGLPVKVIAAGAFEGCTKLENVIVPNSVTTIEEGAFAGCYGLKKMTVPFVGESRSEENAVFGFIFGKKAYAGSVGITQYPNGKSADYWLPQNLIEVTVTDGELNEGCFENCTRLKRIIYEGEARRVEDKAFSGCTSLDEVKFVAETVKKYGDRAFQNCTSLDMFQLDNINEIGEYCFAGCVIEHLEIPSTLQYVGKAAFADCIYIKTVTIPGSVEKLSDNMFQDCVQLESVILESGVETIGKAAFSGCKKLYSVTIASSVDEIKETAFKDCIGLMMITIPAGMEKIGNGAFQGCEALNSVTIENGVKIIGKYAFSSCKALASIELPASVEEIQENAFADCTSLKSILVDAKNKNYAQIDGNIYTTNKEKLLLYSPGNNQDSFVIPEGVKEIDPSAFMNASFLKEVVFPSTMKIIPDMLFYQNTTIRSIVINEGVEKIGKKAFAGCTALTAIDIKGVPHIDEEAFTQCNMLKSVTIDSSNIGDGAFYKCPSLETVILTNVELVGENAFADCYSLKELTFGTGVKVISAEAFANCTALETLNMGPSVTSIGEFTFSNCTKLKNIKLGASLANIGEACFRNCTSIEEVHITSSVTNVNAYAFEGCMSIHTFTVSEYNTSFEAFEGHLVDKSRNLVVFAYAKVAEETVIPEGIRGIGTFVFRNVEIMKRVVLPSTLTYIGNEAFYNTGLTEINLNKVEVIDTYAFGSCEGLKEVDIPRSVNTIKDYAFQGCIFLENVYIRNSVATVGYAIFHNNTEYEMAEINVYIEYNVLPEEWSKGWNAGAPVFQIPGWFFNN